MDFRVAPQAESDLDDIWYFLATQSSNIDVADRVIDRSPRASRCSRVSHTSAVAATKTCGLASALFRSETTSLPTALTVPMS